MSSHVSLFEQLAYEWANELLTVMLCLLLLVAELPRASLHSHGAHSVQGVDARVSSEDFVCNAAH
jgi:hypothetical protein